MHFKFLLVVCFLFFHFVGWGQSSIRKVEAIRHNSETVRLFWITHAGKTCQDIKIERSNNGTNFELIHTVPGICGSSSEELTYTWDDTAPLQGKSFYRIRENENLFSDTVSMHRFNSSAALLLYPNPASEILNIQYLLNDFKPSQIQISNSMGQIVLQQNTNSNDTQLFISNLPNGIYHLDWQMEGFRQQIPLLIIHP